MAAPRRDGLTLPVQTRGVAGVTVYYMPMPSPLHDVVSALDAPGQKPIVLWEAWLFAAADASLALASWTHAADGDKTRAYGSYAAALDREERAARVLERCVRAHAAAANAG
jgi:hypothetical protein